MKSTLFILLVACSLLSHSIKPNRNLDTNKIKHNHPSVTFKTVSTKDGVGILTAYIPPAFLTKKVGMLICYGDSGNLEDWLGYGLMLADNGYPTMMFDYRGFGGSDSTKIEADYLFYHEFNYDAEAALHYFTEEYKLENVGIFALSMGSIMATYMAQNTTNKVKFIIGDSYVLDLDETVSRIRNHYGRELQLPKDYWAYNSDLKRLTIPILLFMGKKDILFDNRKVNELVLHGKRIVQHNGGHLEAANMLKETFIETVNKFIAENVVIKQKNNHIRNICILLIIFILYYLVKAGISLKRKEKEIPNG